MIFTLMDVILIPMLFAFKDFKDGEATLTWLLLPDLFWMADIFLGAITGYYEEMVLVMDPVLVLKRYTYRHLPIDLPIRIGCLTLQCIIISHPHNLGVLLLKLFRVPLKWKRMAELYRKATYSLREGAIDAMTGVVIMLLIIMFIHVTACAWWRVVQENPGEVSAEYQTSSFGESYLAAIYFTLVVIYTGRDDFANSSTERLGAIIVVVFSATVLTCFATFLLKVISEYLERSAQYENRVKLARRFLQAHKCPPGLQVRVRQFLKAHFRATRQKETEEAILAWTGGSASLKAELQLLIRGQNFQYHRVLSLMPEVELSVVCELCTVLHCPSGEVLRTPKTRAQSLLCIVRGCVEVEDPSKAPKTETLSFGTQRSQGVRSVGSQKGQISRKTQMTNNRKSRKSVRFGGGATTGVELIERLKEGGLIDELCIFRVATPSVYAKCSCYCEIVTLDTDCFQEFLSSSCSVALQVAMTWIAAVYAKDEAVMKDVAAACFPIQEALQQIGIFRRPLEFAVEQEATEVVAVMLAEGMVDPDEIKPALEMAESTANRQLIQMLLELMREKDGEDEAHYKLMAQDLEVEDKVPIDGSTNPVDCRQTGTRTRPDGRFVTETVDDLRKLLLRHKVDYRKFKGRVWDLWWELERGNGGIYPSTTTYASAKAPICRVLHILQLHLWSWTPTHGDCLLHLEGLVTPDGKCERKRTHRNLVPTKKMVIDENVFDGIARAIDELLNLPLVWQEQYLELTLHEDVTTEESESTSYPGMATNYSVHSFHFRVKSTSWSKETGSDAARRILHLPEGGTFDAVREGVLARALRQRWRWCPHDQLCEGERLTPDLRKKGAAHAKNQGAAQVVSVPRQGGSARDPGRATAIIPRDTELISGENLRGCLSGPTLRTGNDMETE
jgi:hypothetical protein